MMHLKFLFIAVVIGASSWVDAEPEAASAPPPPGATSPATMPSAAGREDDFASQMVLATCKVFNKDSTATGFLVRPPAASAAAPGQVLLVTAGHVLEKSGGEEAILVLRSLAPDGSFKRRDFPIKIREGTRPLWLRHSEQDVAVLRFTPPDDALICPIEYDWLADEASLVAMKVHVGQELLVLGYPLRNESNAAGFPIARHGSIASYPLTPVKFSKTFRIDFNTFAGDSGGPVFIADERNPAAVHPLVLGLVESQLRHDEKVTILNEESSLHFPLGISNIIQAQFIRETIDRLDPIAAADEPQKKVKPSSSPPDGTPTRTR